ncbi:MAG: hypothetical protein KatS3mg038_0643 [Candidatus Kapaibacterium sp.]|nr:MAG: hypothetical protein KatS3mg038_0643 [Candidatus Kapabacteria bacterium]
MALSSHSEQSHSLLDQIRTMHPLLCAPLQLFLPLCVCVRVAVELSFDVG